MSDFIIPEIKRCDVYLLYGDSDSKYEAVLPADLVGKLPAGNMDEILTKINRRDKLKLDSFIKQYTGFDSIDQVSKIEHHPSTWCGRVAITYHIFPTRQEADHTLTEFAKQIADRAAAVSEDEWEPTTKEPLPPIKRASGPSLPAKRSDNWGEDELSYRGEEEELEVEGVVFDENAPTEEDLEKNIVVEVLGPRKTLTASLGNTKIASHTNKKILIEAVDGWLARSGKDLRIFHLTDDGIEELDRLGNVKDAWDYYDDPEM